MERYMRRALEIMDEIGITEIQFITIYESDECIEKYDVCAVTKDREYTELVKNLDYDEAEYYKDTIEGYLV